MRKKLVAFVCAASLALAMPVLAFADDYSSPSAGSVAPSYSSPAAPSVPPSPAPAPAPAPEPTVVYHSPVFNSPDGTYTISFSDVTKDADPIDYTISATLSTRVAVSEFTPTDQTAKNFEPSDDYMAVSSFVLESPNFAETGTKVTIAYTTDPKYSGMVCYAFIEHSDGTTEVQKTNVDKDGVASFELDKLSTITFALEKQESANAPAKAAAKDKSAKSPKTGVVL